MMCEIGQVRYAKRSSGAEDGGERHQPRPVVPTVWMPHATSYKKPRLDFSAGAEVLEFRAAYTARNMVLPWRLTRSRVLSFALRIAFSNSVVLCTGVWLTS